MQPKNTLTSVFKQKKRMFAQYAFPQKNGNVLKHTNPKVRVVLSTMYLEQNSQNSLLQIVQL